MFESGTHMAVGTTVLWLAVCVRDVKNKACLLRHELSFPCSSLEKTEPVWLRPKACKFEGEIKKKTKK